MIDDITDYEYDIQGWIEDCFDEMDMRGEHEILLKMCDDLLTMFSWPDYTGSDLKFRKSSALESLGRTEEAVRFCKEWIQKEPENIMAATAGVYAYIKTKEFDAAEKLVDQFIFDKTDCLDENDIMFTVASKLYEAEGKKRKSRSTRRFRNTKSIWRNILISRILMRKMMTLISLMKICRLCKIALYKISGLETICKPGNRGYRR